jgi:hypothetical protein
VSSTVLVDAPGVVAPRAAPVVAPAPPTAFPAARARAHSLPPAALDQQGRLVAFNWLVAAYAHPDWLGPWATLLEPRGQVEMRLLRRASLALLERHNLQQRYARNVDAHPWLLWAVQPVQSLARTLGVAMLGGWVRTRLEREQVAQQLRILDAEQRAEAMRHAATLQALPYPTGDDGWPLSRPEPSAVVDLGVSCLAALLSDASSGSLERFSMRFPRGTVVPLALTHAQRDEALGLIRDHLKNHRDGQGAEPGAQP